MSILKINGLIQTRNSVSLEHCQKRFTSKGHPMTTFSALKYILDQKQRTTLDYFNSCRDKRNLVDYGVPGIVSQKEVEEITSIFLSKTR